MITTHKIIAYSTLFVLMVMIFAVPLTLARHHHVHTTHTMNSCPFMVEGMGLCGMSVAHYFSLWQSVLSTSSVGSAVITFCALIYFAFFTRQDLFKRVAFARHTLDIKGEYVFQNLIGTTLSPRAP